MPQSENQEKSDSTNAVPKERKCPSCQTPIDLIQLSAYSMPIEQNSIPWLQMVNKEIGASLRTFGHTSMNELQFLCFTSACENCGLISWWDIGTEELEDIVMKRVISPKIKWTSNPETIADIIENATSESIKNTFQALLKDIKGDQ